MTAERDSMTLNEVSLPALGVEERSDEAPRAGRAVTCFNWGNAELLLTNMTANVVLLGLYPATATLQSTVYSTSADQPRRVHGTVL